MPDGWVWREVRRHQANKGPAPAPRWKRAAGGRSMVEERTKAAGRRASLRCSGPGREEIRSIGTGEESRLDGSLGEERSGGLTGVGMARVGSIRTLGRRGPLRRRTGDAAESGCNTLVMGRVPPDGSQLAWNARTAPQPVMTAAILAMTAAGVLGELMLIGSSSSYGFPRSREGMALRYGAGMKALFRSGTVARSSSTVGHR